MWLAPMFESTMALMTGDFGRASELAMSYRNWALVLDPRMRKPVGQPRPR